MDDLAGPRRDRLDAVLAFLTHLNHYRVSYDIACVRPDALMVTIATPGKHWEVEFMASDWSEEVQVECFRSQGDIATSVASLWTDLEIPALQSE